MKQLLKQSICIIAISFLFAAALPRSAPALSAYDLWDVKSNWARPAVNYVLSKGYMSGVSSTRFDPSGTVSRAQLAQTLYQMAGAPEEDLSGEPFADVRPGSWYESAVAWCSHNHIISGTKPGIFDPDAPVTREQACVMARNFCREYLKIAAQGQADMSAYADWPKVSEWAREAVSWANGSGFMNGTSDRTLSPGGSATREQLAQFLYNLDVRVLGQDPGPGEEDPPYNISTVRLADKGGTKIIAHRGAGGTATENTLEAFTRSGSRSYYGLECDVQRTRDGEYVVFHDSDLHRMTGRYGSVSDYTLGELRSFPLYETRSERRVGGKNTRLRIPTLSEYLEVCKRCKKRAVIELGLGLGPSDAVKIAEIVRSEKYLGSSVFISYYFDLLTAIRKRLPDQPLMLNCDAYTRPGSYLPRLRRYKIGCNCDVRVLTRDLVSTLHAGGLKVGCWTVNEAEDAGRVISWGVDYITTDILE